MRTLTIFYDPRCGLCARFRTWLEGQTTRVPVEFLAYDSMEAGRRFPGLEALGPGREVVVLADDGRWWQGAAAWITCLWTTADYHEWSFRLATPALLPWVGKVVHLISENRLTISRLLHLRTESGLADAIRSLPDNTCGDGSCPTLSDTTHYLS